MKLALFSLLAVILFALSGCSSKQYFKPSEIDGKFASSATIPEVSKSTLSAAVLEDGRILVGDEPLDLREPEGKELLGYSDGWVIFASVDGGLDLYNLYAKSTTTLDLKTTVAAASVNANLLAVLFSNNEMAIYDLSTKELLFKEQGDSAIVVSHKIVAPYFRDNLVLFPTLDGKVVVVDAISKKRLRSTIVSGEKLFNNVIFFELLDGKVIAATPNKILSLSQKELRLSLDLRALCADEKKIYAATKQGEIILLDSDLNELVRKKFAFSHILALTIKGKKIYALEKMGYVIEMPLDLSSYKIYSVDLEDDASVYAYKDRFLVGKRAIILP